MALPSELFAGHQSSLSCNLLLAGIDGCRLCLDEPLDHPTKIQTLYSALDVALPTTSPYKQYSNQHCYQHEKYIHNIVNVAIHPTAKACRLSGSRLVNMSSVRQDTLKSQYWQSSHANISRSIGSQFPLRFTTLFFSKSRHWQSNSYFTIIH